MELWQPSAVVYKTPTTEIFLVAAYTWVIKKRVYDDCSGAAELEFLRLTHGAPCRHQIETPSMPDSWFGYTSDGYWYVMRLYAQPGYLLGRHWRIFARQSLEFLEDLHCRYRQIHGDIKLANILYDTCRREFVIADYNLVGEPDCVLLTQDTSFSHRWYYYRYGAEPDEPCLSYRMDLTMWVYLIMDITWPDGGAPPFVEAFQKKRVSCDSAEPSDEELFAMRTHAVATAHPIVRKLLVTIDAVIPWCSAEPPPASLYSALTSFLTE